MLLKGEKGEIDGGGWGDGVERRIYRSGGGVEGRTHRSGGGGWGEKKWK